MQKYESMFDDYLQTYWEGVKPTTEQNKVTVTFNDPVEFHGVYIVTRPDQKKLFDGSYQTMCLVIDDEYNRNLCTSFDKAVDVGELIVFPSVSSTPVTQVELRMQHGERGQIADFKIHYKGTLMKLYFVYTEIYSDFVKIISCNIEYF